MTGHSVHPLYSKLMPYLPRLILAAILPIASPLARAINAISNGAFISDTGAWALSLGSGAAATLANDTGLGCVTITNGGSSKSHVNLQQNLRHPLDNGVTYTLTFDARASAGKAIDALLRLPDGTILGGTYGICLTTTIARHTVTYTHTSPTTDQARLAFRIGGDTKTVFIDNISLTRAGSASSLLTPNPDRTWTFNTVSSGGKTWNAGAYDFSYAGYHYGEREVFIDIPSATQTISAVANENITDKLNAAIAALSAGGTVLIPAGTFRIGAGTLANNVTISTDNLVIKGAGMGLTTLHIDPAYHSAPAVANRQSATFETSVITFEKPGSNGWPYSAPITEAVSPVALGSHDIVVDDASLLSIGDDIVIRQIMWEDFVYRNAYNPIAYPDKPYRWTNYGTTTPAVPYFSHPRNSFAYRRTILAISGNTLTVDIPIARDLDPADATITIALLDTPVFTNCGLQDLSFTAAPETGVVNAYNSLGTTVLIKGLHNGLFKNVNIASFRSLGLATMQATGITFLNCTAASALNCGTDGSGYGYYINGQNLLYKDCNARDLRHGYTTIAPQTSNIAITNCTSRDYRFNPDIVSGESVDDTHGKYAHAILWDNHYSNEAGLIMSNRGTFSSDAYETCGWSIVWNYQNQGLNTLSSAGYNLRHNLLAVTPAEFGLVIGAHSGGSSPGISVLDGQTHYPSYNWGTAITTSALHVGSVANRVLYEKTHHPVAGSLYDIQLDQRAKLLP